MINSQVYPLSGIEKQKSSPPLELLITLNDGVKCENDDIFSESVRSNYGLPTCSTTIPLYTCKETGKVLPPFQSTITNINQEVEQQSNNDELDIELAEQLDSFLQEITQQESIQNLNKIVEYNKFFQLKFMNLSRKVKDSRFIYTLTYHCPMSSIKPIEIVLRDSLKDRELCRVFNIYSDFLKSVPQVNRIYFLHFQVRLNILNQNHSYKHIPEEIENFNCNQHVDPELETIKITMSKQLKSIQVSNKIVDKNKQGLKRKREKIKLGIFDQCNNKNCNIDLYNDLKTVKCYRSKWDDKPISILIYEKLIQLTQLKFNRTQLCQMIDEQLKPLGQRSEFTKIQNLKSFNQAQKFGNLKLKLKNDLLNELNNKLCQSNKKQCIKCVDNCFYCNQWECDYCIQDKDTLNIYEDLQEENELEYFEIHFKIGKCGKCENRIICNECGEKCQKCERIFCKNKQCNQSELRSTLCKTCCRMIKEQDYYLQYHDNEKGGVCLNCYNGQCDCGELSVDKFSNERIDFHELDDSQSECDDNSDTNSRNSQYNDYQ